MTLLVIAIAALFTAVTAWITYDVADASHTTIDGSTYRYQARVFALGRLVVPAAPVQTSFAMPHVLTRHGKRYSIFSPGFPALLAVGAAANADWLVNPLLAGWVIVGTFWLGRRHFGAPVGAAAVILLATSPWLLVHATTFLSHLTCVSLLLAAALLLGPGRDRGGWAAFACGLLVGAAGLVRMYTAAVHGAFVGALFVRAAVGGRAAPNALPLFLFGLTLAGLGQVGWNLTTTGHPLVTAYQEAWKEPMFGFGPTTPDHTFAPARGFAEYTPRIAALATIRQLHCLADSFSPADAVGLALPLLGLAWAIRRRNRAALLLAGVALAQVVAYAFYRKTTGLSAVEAGPRFWFETLPLLALLGALPIGALLRGAGPGRAGALGVLAALAATSWLRAGPEAVRGLEARHEGGIRPNRTLERALESLPPGPRLVFVDPSTLDIRAAMLVGRPDLTGETVVAILRDAVVNRSVVDSASGRTVWRATAPWPEGIRIEPYDPETPPEQERGRPACDSLGPRSAER